MTRFLTEPDAVGVTVELRKCNGCAGVYGVVHTPIGPRPLQAAQAVRLFEQERHPDVPQAPTA
jgi:hypothetical protein